MHHDVTAPHESACDVGQVVPPLARRWGAARARFLPRPASTQLSLGEQYHGDEEAVVSRQITVGWSARRSEVDRQEVGAPQIGRTEIVSAQVVGSQVIASQIIGARLGPEALVGTQA
jgi:hypothetical protein